MNFKHWPYWVKGGTVILSVGLILLGILFYLVQSTCIDGGFETSCTLNNPWAYRHSQLFNVLQLSILPLIIAGVCALVFGFYGKIKNRKQLNTGSPPTRG